MSKAIGKIEKLEWPANSVPDYFSFTAACDAGLFTFDFKWQNSRWDCWVTLPDGTKRQAGVYSNVMNWTGYLDYSVIFMTDLQEIQKDAVTNTEIYLITWQ